MADTAALASEPNNFAETTLTPRKIALNKHLSLSNSIALIVGTVIGSGIFISPTGILRQTNSIGLSLVIWLGCGVVAMLGAFCYIELGTAIKKSGAEYAYLLEAFGPVPAYLFAWTAVIIIRPSACAIVAIIFAEYVSKPFFVDCSPPQELVKLLACVCLALVAAINCWSVRTATRVQDLFTCAKLLCILMLIIIGVVQLARGKFEYLQNGFHNSSTNPGSIALAFYLGLWAYDGWNTMNYCTEEMKRPERDLPRAVIVGISLITVSYLLVNVAYITVLGPNGILQADAVAISVGNAYLGYMNWLVPIFVAASTFGAVNGTAFSSGRLLFVTAREGHMPALLAMIQVHRLTPLPSLLCTTVVAMVMLIPEASSFIALLDFFSFAAWLGYGATFVALLWLRYKKPYLQRPYKVWLVVPIAMAAISLFLVIAPIKEQPVGSLIAFGSIVAGLLPYAAFVHPRCAPRCILNFVDSFTKWCQKVFDLALEEQGVDFE